MAVAGGPGPGGPRLDLLRPLALGTRPSHRDSTSPGRSSGVRSAFFSGSAELRSEWLCPLSYFRKNNRAGRLVQIPRLCPSAPSVLLLRLQGDRTPESARGTGSAGWSSQSPEPALRPLDSGLGCAPLPTATPASAQDHQPPPLKPVKGGVLESESELWLGQRGYGVWTPGYLRLVRFVSGCRQA